MQSARPRLVELTAVFVRIVNLTFGGGDPTMAALERELVSRRGWLPAHMYGLTYALARITPGTNLIAFCAGVAWTLAGWTGAVLAVIAGTVPSAVLVVWLTYAYEVMKDSRVAAGATAGMLASAAGMMFAAAWNLLRPHLHRRSWARATLLAGGSAALMTFALPPVEVLGLAALAGFLWREGKLE